MVDRSFSYLLINENKLYNPLQVRKLCALELLSARSVQTFQFVREEEVDAIIRKIHEAAVNGDVVDLTKINIVSRCVISRKAEDDNGGFHFGELTRRVMVLFTTLCFGDFWPSLKWLDYVIDEHKEKEAIDEKKDFISIILQLQKDGLDLTQGNIKAIILVFFFFNSLLLISLSVKLGNYDIPPDTTVFINVWAIQRDPTWWENPEEFIPERFENSRVDFKGQDFQFIPFGCGRRDCPGMPFAIASLEYLVANLLFRFDWKLGDGETSETLDLIENYGLTVNKKVPLRVMPTIFHPST
ncbi:hypothetical protein GOBAR_AA21782 [Gossypium barbadense]|uniref:Cytochrome P450 n=1 Tax=Gossypium barbadense TaxID=3634 RepID=A0A2P5X6B0_GOSBA|nr:hypothetical protein GOBAR_AA21782 [Gossypium barbadense]